ncbi:MAG TPA: PmoA family protein [Bryobacterales bacterium]|nr:PmoA family protein [Bryobacterales bacterium]
MRIRRIILTCALLLPSLSWAQVQFKESPGKVEVEIDGKPFTTLYYGGDAPKPYLHPLRAASGTIVTRGYPMENIRGEQRDHPHHRGLWFTHGEVNGLDFWANELSAGRPRGGLVEPLEVRTGPGGVISGTFLWKTPGGLPILREERTMRFHPGAPNRMIDFDVKFTALAEEVHFGDTKEGMFAIRLATPLEEPHARAEGVVRTGTITSADGKTGEKNLWGKRSPWLDYSGAIEGEKLGVAILDHPSNPKHPTYWHVRSYGLFAANIFGEHDFHRDPKRDGSVTLKSGEVLRFQYRVVIHPGDVKSADVAGLYQKYVSEQKSGPSE